MQASRFFLRESISTERYSNMIVLILLRLCFRSGGYCPEIWSLLRTPSVAGRRYQIKSTCRGPCSHEENNGLRRKGNPWLTEPISTFKAFGLEKIIFWTDNADHGNKNCILLYDLECEGNLWRTALPILVDGGLPVVQEGSPWMLSSWE